ncbi:MAG: TATA-box-binding protein [Promethearchaeota archaeon]
MSVNNEMIDPNQEIDYKIENVVATVTLELEKKIDLTIIARKQPEVEYNPENFPGLVMRIEEPRATILIFSTGKMVITGLRKASEAEEVVVKTIKKMKKAGIKEAKYIITIQNIVASGDLHINVDLNLASIVMDSAMYEPEVFPGLIYRMQDPKTVFLIFSTGRVVCTGAKHKKVLKEAFFKLVQEVQKVDIARDDLKDAEYDDIMLV